MRNKEVWLYIFLILFSLSMPAQSQGAEVNIKGVLIESPANHIENGKMYVDVEAFSRLTGLEYSVNKEMNTITMEGKIIQTKEKDGMLTAHIRTIAQVSDEIKVSWDSENRTVYVSGLVDQSSHKAASKPALEGQPAQGLVESSTKQQSELPFGMVILVIGLIFFTLLGAALLRSLFERKMQMEKRLVLFLKSSTKEEEYTDKSQNKKGTVKKFFLSLLLNRMRTYTAEKMPRQTVKTLQTKLRDAGNPYGLTPIDFRILQCGLAAFLALLIIVLFLPSSTEPLKTIFLGLLVGSIGLYYPVAFLDNQKKQRMKRIEKTMPDFFDMLNLSIEAGMGLDAALRKVCSQSEGPIAEEFTRVLDDMKLGKSRRETFTELRDRVDSELFQGVIRALIQADQLGIGMSKVLRTQTVRIREQQRQSAREQAMKAPVKMLIPMVLFIFPTLFIVILGPAVIKIIVDFKGGFL
jgi:tight adherence protein C